MSLNTTVAPSNALPRRPKESNNTSNDHCYSGGLATMRSLEKVEGCQPTEFFIEFLATVELSTSEKTNSPPKICVSLWPIWLS